MGSQTLLEAENLTKAFGAQKAVNGVSLALQAGQIYGLVGPDGAGKTTTMRLLCGALQPDAGSVRIGGDDLLGGRGDPGEAIGYLPQGFSLYGELTVVENLRFFAEVRGLSRELWERRSKQILTFVGLDEFGDRKADDLSGGMKKKLGLAVALIHWPRILLLDEPTGGVDPVTRQVFWRLLIRLLRDGVTVLLSTPYMDEAARCHRVGFMERGRMLVEGSPGDVIRGLQGRILEVEGGPRKLLRKLAEGVEGVEDVQMFGDRLHLRVAESRSEAVRRALQAAAQGADVKVTRIRPVSPTLEDVFIELLQKENGRHA